MNNHLHLSLRTVILRKRADHATFGIYLSEDVPSGLYVVTIEPNSPAAEARIEPGDRLLAVNGRAIATMSSNPKYKIAQLAQTARILSLMIQPMHLLDAIETFFRPSSKSNGYPSSSHWSSEPVTIDRDLKKYIRAMFPNEHLQIMPLPSAKGNEFTLLSYTEGPHRHHRRARHHRTKQTQTSEQGDEQTEESPSTTPERSVPSMGTSHVKLRQLQSSTKSSETDRSQLVSSLPTIGSTIKSGYSNPEPMMKNTPLPATSPTGHQSQTPTNRSSPHFDPVPPPMIENDLREIHLRRLPTFKGFGFHIEYNKIFYLVHRVEPNSPAARSGLRTKDIILQINHEPTDNISHPAFVQKVQTSSEVHFLVQDFESYRRAHPEISSTDKTKNSVPAIITNLNTARKSSGTLNRVLSRLKSR